MKKSVIVMLLGLVVVLVSSCSSDNTPTPKKLSQDVQAVPPESILSAISEETLEVPKNAQIMVKLAKFKAYDNLYDGSGASVLIPQNSIVSGLYTNDGIVCEISWKAVYATRADYKANMGSMALAQVTYHSQCDPQHGVKAGERVTISFKSNLIEQYQ